MYINRMPWNWLRKYKGFTIVQCALLVAQTILFNYKLNS